MEPAEGLENQRHGRRPSSTKDDRADRHPLGVVRFLGQGRIVLHRRREAAVRMSRRLSTFRIPRLPLPVDQVGRWGIVLPFPPDIPVRSAGYVGENGVVHDGFNRVGIGLFVRSRSHPKVSIFRIDGVQSPIRTRLHPGNIIPDGGDLPPLIGFGRNHHGKVRLSTGRRESRRDVGLSAVGILHAQN